MSLMPVVLLPDRQDSRAVQAWVDAAVDGRRLRMLLDTGSGRSAIPASLLSWTEPPQSSGRGVSGVEGINRRARVRSLALTNDNPGAAVQ
jgi:hypothetical protein